MPARAPFKNLCPRERTRLSMLKESASSLLPRAGDSCSNAMFPPGTAVGPMPPRAAPAFLRRASPRQSRSFPERPSFLRFRPHSFVPRRRAQALLRQSSSPRLPFPRCNPVSSPCLFPPPSLSRIPLVPPTFCALRLFLFPSPHIPSPLPRTLLSPAPRRRTRPAVFAPPFGTVPFQPCTPVSHSCSTREKIRFPGEITNFFSGIRPPPLDLAPPPCYRFFELKNSEGCFPKAHRDPA